MDITNIIPRTGRRLTLPTNTLRSSDNGQFQDGFWVEDQLQLCGPRPPRCPSPSSPCHYTGSPRLQHRRNTDSQITSFDLASRLDPNESHILLTSSPISAVNEYGSCHYRAKRHRPLPMSSTSFQQAMFDLKTTPDLHPVSPLDFDNSSGKETRYVSPIVTDRLPPPAIEITASDEGINYDHYAIDIDLFCSVENEVFAPPEAHRLQNRKSISDKSILNSTSFHKCQLTPSLDSEDAKYRDIRCHQRVKKQRPKSAIGLLSFPETYADHVVVPSSSQKKKSLNGGINDQNDIVALTIGFKGIDTQSSKGPGHTKGGRKDTSIVQKTNQLTIPFTGGTLRKWRSTEESLPTNSSTHMPRISHRSLQSPYISSPFLRRKASVPEISLSTKHRETDQDEVSSTQDIQIERLSPSSSNSYDSPSTSPSTNRKTDTSSLKPTRHYQAGTSVIDMKTAGKLTRFITAASASSSPGVNKRKHLIPDAFVLPPVLDSSGRLLQRRRDDSLRLIKQAVISDSVVHDEDDAIL